MKKRKKHNDHKSKKKPKKAPPKKTSGMVMWLLNNVSFAILFSFLLYLSYSNVSGYQWVMNNLIRDNIDFITKNPELSLDQKNTIKLHFEWTYLNYLATNTPKNAVILFPFEDRHYKDPKFKVNNYRNPKLTIMRKEHISSFLYPRKVVFLKDKSTDPHFSEISHLAIVDFLGYDLLPPEYNRSVQHGLIRLKNNVNISVK